MKWSSIPTDIQNHILSFLIYECHECKHKFFHDKIKNCIECNKYFCVNDYIELDNSVICHKCFSEKHKDNITDLLEIIDYCLMS